MKTLGLEMIDDILPRHRREDQGYTAYTCFANSTAYALLHPVISARLIAGSVGSFYNAVSAKIFRLPSNIGSVNDGEGGHPHG